MPLLDEKFGVSTPFDVAHRWVTSPVFSPAALAVIRLLVAVYTTATLIVVLAMDIHDGAGEAYLSYFTRLSYIGICAYFWASGVQTAFHALHRTRESYPLQRWPRPLQFLHILLFATITTFPIIVTIVFWALLASSGTFSTTYSVWENISVHAMNSVFALFEIFLTNAGPAPWLHAPLVLVLIACYLGVAYITHATQGFYTYSFLDPAKQHARVAAYIVGIAVATLLFFTIARYACVLRERLARGRGLRDTAGAGERREELQEWEEIHIEKDVRAGAAREKGAAV